MMQQYVEVRRQLPPGTLLLFRLGDFYELFEEDAKQGAEILGITLTQRHGMPMAGIPFHACDTYINRLLGAGRKVAICEQTEAPRPGQLVKRALTRILTPGTTIEDHQIEARRNHYLLALDLRGEQLAAAWLDLSTGDFQVAADPVPERLLSVFAALDPREVLLPEDGRQTWAHNPAHARFLEQLDGLWSHRPTTPIAALHFDPLSGARAVTETLGVLTLDGFGIREDHPGLGPAGAVLHYATESLCSPPQNLSLLREYRSGSALLIDPATLRNLEIFKAANGTREGSLLAAMDGTVTAPGARLLEQWLAAPPLDLGELRRRQAVVGEFLEAPAVAGELQEYLRCVRDLPRILGRLRNRLRNPRELGGIRDTLRQVPLILGALGTFEGFAVQSLGQRVQPFQPLRELLDRALNEELPADLTVGGCIAPGYDPELDRLRSLTRDNQSWIAELEAREAARTGIKKLRIKYTGAFGYYIEITNANLHLVPADYIRKQTTVNAERFYTPELKEKEREILHADEKAIARETELLNDLVATTLQEAEGLEAMAGALAEIDLLVGWAKLAREWDYCRPELEADDRLEILQGRHPVVEQTLRRQRLAGAPGVHDFVPNDTKLEADGEQIALVTGPNMAGKSTYIRQVALITLMAQVGAWVPARSCHVGLVDRIFSRVGASDELARGNSTFMVEMNETANILNNATARSLVILDEIGRGTSTYDGLSIAWAVVEHLHGAAARGARTLFATHYHELTQLARLLPRLRNYCVAVKEWNDTIIFVRQIQPGAADRSYGLQVARLAGLPPGVLARAQVILEKLESDDSSHNLLRKQLRKSPGAPTLAETPQLELFGGS